MKVKQFIFGLVLFLGLMAHPGNAFAHALETNYHMISDALEVQGVFSTGELFEGAPIVVYSPQDQTHPWLEGVTNKDGKFDFQPDPTIAGDWSIEIGEGQHWDQLYVPVNDRGIEFEAISFLDGDHPHRHYSYNIASQFVIVGVALGSALFSRRLGRSLRW